MSPSCWPRCVAAAWPPTSTKTCPFEVLVERLNRTRSLAHHPLVQVLLAWQNFAGQDSGSAAGLTLGDLQVSPLPVDTHTARMDLTFSLAEQLDRGR